MIVIAIDSKLILLRAIFFLDPYHTDVISIYIRGGEGHLRWIITFITIALDVGTITELCPTASILEVVCLVVVSMETGLVTGRSAYFTSRATILACGRILRQLILNADIVPSVVTSLTVSDGTEGSETLHG